MKIKCVAVDDEPLALEIIEDYISKIPFLELVQSFDNAIDTLNFLRQQQVDLMFLDIQMDDLTGIQLLNVLRERPQIIFTTAYDSFAIQGYELSVTDYLLKPISFERFFKAVNKAHDVFTMLKGTPQRPVDQPTENRSYDYFFVKTEFRMQKVAFDDILYIEGQGDYLRIITKTERIMTLLNFKRLETLLPSDRFVRIHKSYMVAMDKIESVEKNRIKIGGQILAISDTYKKMFFDLLDGMSIV